MDPSGAKSKLRGAAKEPSLVVSCFKIVVLVLNIVMLCTTYLPNIMLVLLIVASRLITYKNMVFMHWIFTFFEQQEMV